LQRIKPGSGIKRECVCLEAKPLVSRLFFFEGFYPNHVKAHTSWRKAKSPESNDPSTKESAGSSISEWVIVANPVC
jgi:hypothetical protein